MRMEDIMGRLWKGQIAYSAKEFIYGNGRSERGENRGREISQLEAHNNSLIVIWRGQPQ